MSNYSFSVVATFHSGLDVGALYDELFYDFSLTTLEGITVDGDACLICFDDDLDSGHLSTLNTAVAAHQGLPKTFTKKHLETEYDSGLLVRETWWARASGDTLTLKVEETLYTYVSGVLSQVQTKQYTRAGDVSSTSTWSSQQVIEGDQRIVKRIEQ